MKTKAVRQKKLRECKAKALDYAWNVVRGTDPHTFGVKAKAQTVHEDAFRIIKFVIEVHGFDPDRVFPLSRPVLAVPPSRTNLKRRNPIEVDPYADDPNVLKIRERIGNLPPHRVQNALTLLRKTGLLTSEHFGHIKGRGKQCVANAWMFGTEIAKLLSAAFLSFQKNQKKRDQVKRKRLSDFLKRGLRDLAQSLLPYMFGKEPSAEPQTPRAIPTGHDAGWTMKRALEKAINPIGEEEKERRIYLSALESVFGVATLAEIPDAPQRVRPPGRPLFWCLK